MAAREAWFDAQPDLDPERLVFIDETGATTKMARTRGKAPRCERLRAGAPHGHWKTTTFVGGLRLGGMTAPMVLDGPMTSAWFLAYVKQILVPTPRRGDVVIPLAVRKEHLEALLLPDGEAASPLLGYAIRSKATGRRSWRPPAASGLRASSPSGWSAPWT